MLSNNSDLTNEVPDLNYKLIFDFTNLCEKQNKIMEQLLKEETNNKYSKDYYETCRKKIRNALQ
jgi:hypothetical protein